MSRATADDLGAPILGETSRSNLHPARSLDVWLPLRHAVFGVTLHIVTAPRRSRRRDRRTPAPPPKRSTALLPLPLERACTTAFVGVTGLIPPLRVLRFISRLLHARPPLSLERCGLVVHLPLDGEAQLELLGHASFVVQRSARTEH